MKKFLSILFLLLVACGPTEQAATPTLITATQASYPAPNISAYPGVNEPEVSNPLNNFIGETPPFAGRIAFHSSRFGLLQLYILDGATGDAIQLNTGASQAYEPAWSPDCQSLIYTHEIAAPKDSDIYVIGANGANPQPLLVEQRVSTLDFAPAWSINGNRIAYQSNPEKMFNVCLTDQIGSDLGCLGRENYSNAHPSWSVDGNQLLFISNRDGDWEIFRTDVSDLGNVVQLTNNSSVEMNPQYSPNGEYILFESNQTANYDIFVMNADGSNVTQLTFDGEDDRDPTWMGNDKILFTSFRDNDWEIYMINRDGSGLTRITYQPGDDKGPAWCTAE
jgi:Tol biopolymer transport system component